MISGFQLQWEVNKQQAGRMIKEFLKEEEISRIALTDIKFNGGKILVNDIEVNVRYVLKEGEFLTVIFPPENPSAGAAGKKSHWRFFLKTNIY